jgi:uncharacterized protein (DUF608 family)
MLYDFRRPLKYGPPHLSFPANDLMTLQNLFTARPPFAYADSLQIAMPMGGIGAGCICLNGQGGLQDFSIRHKPAISAVADGHGFTDAAFALLHIKGENGTTRLLEGPMPPEKIYDQGLKGQGFRQGGFEGLPRFADSTFENGFPFGRVHLEDERLPIRATVTGWNPFIPLDDVNSGMPCALLEYTLKNVSSQRAEFEFSYHLSHLANGGGAKNSFSSVLEDEHARGVLFSNALPEQDEKFGTVALSVVGHEPQIKAMWFRGGWFDPITVLWREVSSGNFVPNDGRESRETGGVSGGSVLLPGALEPGEEITYPVVVAWHFPNVYQSVGAVTGSACCSGGEACAPAGPNWRPFYAGKWEDAGAVARHAGRNYASLRARTNDFARALYSTTAPADIIDAVASNLAIIKSPTVLRQENGNLWGWEGCFVDAGCCAGSCTHVWNYAQALPHLFPALERTLREQELERSLNEAGHVNFRAALPDGPANHNFHAAADGQLGGILKLHREFHISGDVGWLQRLYPLAKRSLDYCIATWDPTRRGGLFEPHHNTYDIEFWGPDGMCCSIYVAALSAFAQLAQALGRPQEAAPYEELAQKAARLMDEALFNGQYYQQQVQWEGLKDTSVVVQIAAGSPGDTYLAITKAEGPKYQYASGCLSDGIIGAWMAKIYGIATPLSNDHVRSTLASIFASNFKADLVDHACTQRPGYAWGHEGGLVVCTWPRGGRPTLPFVYCDEVFTGIEYQVASHMIAMGMVEEALTIVAAARARYDGRKRNPFNEYECGNYYARAMASFALLNTYSGFFYDSVSKTVRFAPATPGDFGSFFSTNTGFGTISRHGGEVQIEVIEGELAVEKLIVGREPERQYSWNCLVRPGQMHSLQAG